MSEPVGAARLFVLVDLGGFFGVFHKQVNEQRDEDAGCDVPVKIRLMS